MSRIVHFELPVDNADRAITFYQQVFGWKFNKFEGPMDYWLVSTGDEGAPGIDGGMMPRQQPGQGTTNVIGVKSVDAAVKSLEGAGASIVVPKMAIPGIGYAAYFVDPEGNTLGVFEDDPKAA